MFDQWQSWWQNTAPETQLLFQEGSVLLLALLGGQIIGKIAARALRAKNFDAALRLPGTESEHGVTPTLIAGLLVRLTIWALAAWWLAHRHGQVELANTLGLAINRIWALATIVVAALALGSLLAHRLIACLHGLGKVGPESVSSRNGVGASRFDAAAGVAAGVYFLVVLLALLFAADLFDWPLTRTSALALWDFAQHLLIAVAALFIGCLGARWSRELAMPDAGASPEKRAGQYTALGIMAGTTLLAVAVLLSSAGVLIGLAALALLAFLLWTVRGYLPDVMAGLQLRGHGVREVYLDGTAWQITEIGFITTHVSRAGEFWRMQNRHVLEARMHGTSMEAAAR